MLRFLFQTHSILTGMEEVLDSVILKALVFKLE